MIDFDRMHESETATFVREMTDDDLHASAVYTAERERKVTLALIRHLNEIERRHLYSKFRTSSLHAYCVKELKFDDGTAGRRVSAARLIKNIPVIEQKILSGAVTLTAVAQAGIFFRKKERSGNSLSLEAKQDLILELENKSTRQVDQILISNSSAPEIHFKEKITPKTSTLTEARLHFDEETMAALNRLKEIWSHANPHGALSDIIKRAALEAVEKHDPRKKIARYNERLNKKASSRALVPSFPQIAGELNSAPKSVLNEAKVQLIPTSKADMKRSIWKRDRCQCTFIDPRTGDRCGSKHFLEEDHIRPKAAGGDYSVENIRLRCRAHNQRHAINFFGIEKMRPHLNRGCQPYVQVGRDLIISI